jgi:hypothetical protein
MEFVRRLPIVGTSIRADAEPVSGASAEAAQPGNARVQYCFRFRSCHAAPPPPGTDHLLGRGCGFPAPAFCCCYRCRTRLARQDRRLYQWAQRTKHARFPAARWLLAKCRGAARKGAVARAGRSRTPPRAPLRIQRTSTLLIVPTLAHKFFEGNTFLRLRA